VLVVAFPWAMPTFPLKILGQCERIWRIAQLVSPANRRGVRHRTAI
jgi:hypothetical protein